MAQSPIFGEVYVATSPSDKSYVGQTTQGSVKRWKDHVRHARLANHPEFRYPFARALRKHGADTFQTQVLSIARNKEELDNLEKIWIILLNTREAGYNITAGGEGHPMPHTPESIAKMSAAKVGNKFCVGRQTSAETRFKLGNGNRGRKLSIAWKSRIADGVRGRVQSSETKDKIAAANTGRIFTEEHLKNLKIAQQARRRRERK